MSLHKKPFTYIGALSAVLVGLLGFSYFSSQNKRPDPVMVELDSPGKKKSPQETASSTKKDAPRDGSADIISQSDQGEKVQIQNSSGGKEKRVPRENSPKDVKGATLPAPIAKDHSSQGAMPSQTHPQSPTVASREQVPQKQEIHPTDHAGVVQNLPQKAPAKILEPNLLHEDVKSPGSASSQSAHQAHPDSALKGGTLAKGEAKQPSLPVDASQKEPYVVSLEELNKPRGLTSYEEAALIRPGKIVLMLIGLGRQEELTQDAAALPKEVALAFHEGADTIEVQKQAHEAGHETFVMVPMEPVDYPKSDPGPMPLLTGISASENLQRLESHLNGRIPCTGVVPFLGSRFMFSEKDLSPILTYIHQKGLLFVDILSTHQSVLEELSAKLKIPNISAHICLGDREMDKESIDERLVILEKNARLQGHIIVFAWVRPAMLFCLEEWIPTLAKKNIQLIPFSALTSKEKKE